MSSLNSPPLVLPLEKLLSGAKELSFVWIPPSRFVMGSGYAASSGVLDDLADAPFEVELSRGCWMSQHPVTQAQWLSLFPGNPSEFVGPNLPVDSVDWHEACFFARQLQSVVDGYLPPETCIDLPTEAQWEYGCSAGSTSRFSVGDEESDLARTAWYAANSGGSTHPVGSKASNSWHIFDMIGNVAEWCRDGAEDYPSGFQRDWEGMNAFNKIIRGGAWSTSHPGDLLSVKGRGYLESTFRSSWVGFRLVISVDHHGA